jgi:predicted secreted hydrolase
MTLSRRELLRLLGGLPLAGLVGQTSAQPGPPLGEVTPRNPVRLPRDHAAHPTFGVEWWYFTGFLELAGGGRRTFEVTFFRSRPEPGAWEANPSPFTPRQVYSAHAALGNPATQEFRHWRRLAREGLDGGGSAADRLAVHLRDWSLEEGADGPWRLRVATEDGPWDLRLQPTGKPVLHGEAGVNAKNTAGSVASYYYTYPAMGVSGMLPDGEVTGTAWFDHEWTSTFLPEGTAGWDWVGLRFADGSALMAFRFRDARGDTAYRGGTWIAPDRSTRVLGQTDLSWRPLRHWTSAETGFSYPVDWEIRVLGRRLRVTALFDGQELRGTGPFSPTYWEGAMAVSGDRAGEGFLEMTRFGGGGEGGGT